MEDLTQIRTALTEYLRDATATDPLQALSAIGAVQHDVAGYQRDAVRAAAKQHSWTEIGDALGVSKQAAHQKFAKEWAVTLRHEVKAEHRAYKAARRRGAGQEAVAAKAKMDEVITELKNVAGRGR